MKPFERDIEKQLRRMVGRNNGLCLKWVCPGWSGVPDRICLFPGGYVCFVELKRPDDGVISPQQKRWSEILRGLGFDFYFISKHEEINALELLLKDALWRRK